MAEEGTRWEKTVEWAFVRSCLPEEVVASPLSGNVELSDALVGSDSRWLLIELKRSRAVCDSEVTKYPAWNSELTGVIIRRHYKNHVEELSSCLTKKEGWWDRVLFAEKFVHMAGNLTESLPAVFEIAGRELNGLIDDFRKVEWTSDQAKEPHYFVFPEQGRWAALEAQPYWSDCFPTDPSLSRGAFPVKAKEIWKNTVNYSVFTEYAIRLARARGYPEGVILDEADASSALAEQIVFGYSVGQTKGESGEWVVMTLREFYASNQKLISSLAMRKKKIGI